MPACTTLRVRSRPGCACVGALCSTPGCRDRAIEGLPPAQVPAERFAKGRYFTPDGRAPFSRLVYPVPQPGGLGVQLNLDLAGQARFGPDVEWLEPGQAFDYAVDPARAAAFHQPSATIGRGCTRAGCCPATPASAPSCPAPVNRRRISVSTARKAMACPTWSTCSASNRPA